MQIVVFKEKMMFRKPKKYFCSQADLPAEVRDTDLVNGCVFMTEDKQCHFPGRCIHRRDEDGNRKMEL
jgi:hypothetical protein